MSEFKCSNESIFVASAQLAKGFTVIPNEIMNDIPIMESDAFTVFAKILQYISNPNHKISIQGLSTQVKMSKRRVSNAVNKLIEIGYIKRTPIKNGNLICGYLYEVFSEKQTYVNDNVNVKSSSRESIGNTASHRNPQNGDTENGNTDFRDTEYRDDNKENNNKKNSNQKNIVVVDKEKELFDLYKTFNLEKRFMPHTKKLLQEYVDKFDLEVFEQVFISASSDSVSKKYAYIKKVFETLAAKNIRTLADYLKDQDDYKNSKNKKTSSKSKSDNKVKTKYHDTFNEHYKEYSSDELEEGLKGNQEKKGINNQSINEKLYIMACEIGLDSLSNDAVRSLVIDYAKSNNLEIPHR